MSNVGKQIPSWIHNNWKNKIDEVRALGYGILPDGALIKVGDYKWWILTRTYKDKEQAGLTDELVIDGKIEATYVDEVGETRVAGQLDTAHGATDENGCRVAVFRKDYIEDIEIEIDEKSFGPARGLNMKWSCGHQRGVENACVVCSVMYNRRVRE